MAKKKTKKTKTPNNLNHKKNNNSVNTKVAKNSKEQTQKNNALKTAGICVENFFVKTGLIVKKYLINIKNYILKSVVVWDFIKNHKRVFAPVFALLYTVAIVFLTLGVEHCVFPLVLPESVETNQDETVEIKQFKMEQGQVYRVSPDSVLQYEGYEFTNTIRPKNVEKAGEYFGQSYVNENEDNMYLDIVFKYTNKSDVSVRGDQIMSVVATAGDVAYEDIFTAIENKDGTDIDFSSSVEIAPGDYALVHSVFDVPKDTQQKTDIKAEIIAQDKSYVIAIGEKTGEQPETKKP